MYGHFTAHKYRVLADYLDVAPADVDIVLSSEQSEQLRFPEYHDPAYLRCRRVEFHVVRVSHFYPAFYVYYLLVSDVVKCTEHTNHLVKFDFDVNVRPRHCAFSFFKFYSRNVPKIRVRSLRTAPFFQPENAPETV